MDVITYPFYNYSWTVSAKVAVTGELFGVYCEDLGENWRRYNGTALYIAEQGILVLGMFFINIFLFRLFAGL